MKQSSVVVFAVAFLVLSQCGTPPKTCASPCERGSLCMDGVCVPTGMNDASVPPDEDAGTEDAGEPDAGVDAGAFDAGEVDAGFDAGEPDSGSDAGLDDAGVLDAGSVDAGPVVRVRLMAANLTSGNNQNYDLGHGIRIMQGAHPDIVMVQELRYMADTPTAIQGMADSIIGAGSHFCRETFTTGDIPNGVFSRWPIVACGEWDDSRIANRDYLWARIDVPGPTDLWAISVHFSTQATNRPTEGQEIVTNVMNMIPSGDFVVLGGDLNTDDELEPVFTTLAQVFAVFPQPTDQFGNPGTNTNRLITLADGGLDPQRNQPYDWVMPTPNLRALEQPIVLTDGVNTINVPNGFVIDTRVFDAGNIGLIAPAQLGDSAAPNMQHMGVIRDFDLPQ